MFTTVILGATLLLALFVQILLWTLCLWLGAALGQDRWCHVPAGVPGYNHHSRRTVHGGTGGTCTCRTD